MKSVDFHGYTIYEDGTVIGLYGKEIKQHINGGRYQIRLNIEGKRRSFITSRLIYYVFNPFDIDDVNLCVTYKDDNPLNHHLDNLELIHRKDLIQGDGHRSRTVITEEQAEEIRSLYQGKTGSNQHDKEGYSLNDLAKKYNTSKSNIAAIVKGRSRNEDGYILK